MSHRSSCDSRMAANNGCPSSNEGEALAAGAPTRDALVEFMRQRIENGDLALEDIVIRLVDYGLMSPTDFVAEMAERMALMAAG